MYNKKFRPKFAMYSANAVSFATLNLARYSEIPDSIHNDHAGYLKALTYENQYLAKDSNSNEKFLLDKKKNLVLREAGYITRRLKPFSKVNFINLHEFGLNDSLNLISPLLQEGKLAKYLMAGQSDMVNQQWANTAQTHALAYGHKLEVDCLKTNFHMRSYLNPINSLAPRDKDTANLFFFGESTLGNYLNPARILTNICASMNYGDYLVFSQDLYRPGTEGFWVGN